jgi:hypothetical protein
MRKDYCEVIRRELDELMLDEAGSSSALEHLRDCAGCREFYQKQTKLRRMVGSLGTVAAPPDFDFRLRARLANEANSATFHLQSVYWPFVRRGVAVAAALLVVATGVVVVRNIMNRPETVAIKSQPAVNPAPAPITAPKPEVKPEHLVAANPQPSAERVKNERPVQTAVKPKRTITAVDFSSQRAEVINGLEAVGSTAVFPLDASLQSFKVSLDDGRGNARTISVPTISFGSQRVLKNANSFAPKDVW